MTAVPAPSHFWLGTSWKMTKTLADAAAYADELGSAVQAGRVPAGLQLFVLPAATALSAVHGRLGGLPGLCVGAQNAYPGPDGAVTGEVSMGMVRDAGARLVEIGHAERRTLLGETDELVAAKVAGAVSAGLLPLVCVGETAAERDRGTTADVLAHQVRSAFAGLRASGGTGDRADTRDRATTTDVLIAYEPHWAIGSRGRAAAPDDVAAGLAVIRETVHEELPGTGSGVLYGGSVDADNAAGLVTGLDLDGLFVGRAAWTASGLLDLAHRCADAVRARASIDHVPANVRKDR